MTRIFKIIILSAIFFFILVVFLMINGKLTFGGCLADLIPFYFQIIWTIILFLVYIILLKRKTISKLLLIIFSAVIIFSVLFSIRGFTIGRENCYPWNGQIFVIHNK